MWAILTAGRDSQSWRPRFLATAKTESMSSVRVNRFSFIYNTIQRQLVTLCIRHAAYPGSALKLQRWIFAQWQHGFRLLLWAYIRLSSYKPKNGQLSARIYAGCCKLFIPFILLLAMTSYRANSPIFLINIKMQSAFVCLSLQTRWQRCVSCSVEWHRL